MIFFYVNRVKVIPAAQARARIFMNC